MSPTKIDQERKDFADFAEAFNKFESDFFKEMQVRDDDRRDPYEAVKRDEKGIIWTTKDGRDIYIKKMSSQHIRNTLAFLESNRAADTVKNTRYKMHFRIELDIRAGKPTDEEEVEIHV